MIHYHGGPITPMPVGLAVWKCRHAMVSFARPDQISLAAEISQSFAIDNGAYSLWTQGGQLDVEEYLRFVKEWRQHPSFDWAVIPDVIDGTEEENDRLITRIAQHFLSPACSGAGSPSIFSTSNEELKMEALCEREFHWPHDWVPVWHLHESLTRLESLVHSWPRVAFGSSGEYSDPGSSVWWSRMSEAMEIACDSTGRPKCRFHGLRMMDPTIFSHVPFASVDSTNVARNCGLDTPWRGSYRPLTEETRALVLVDRIENHASSKRWTGSAGVQKNLELVG